MTLRQYIASHYRTQGEAALGLGLSVGHLSDLLATLDGEPRRHARHLSLARALRVSAATSGEVSVAELGHPGAIPEGARFAPVEAE